MKFSLGNYTKRNHEVKIGDVYKTFKGGKRSDNKTYAEFFIVLNIIEEEEKNCVYLGLDFDGAIISCGKQSCEAMDSSRLVGFCDVSKINLPIKFFE